MSSQLDMGALSMDAPAAPDALDAPSEGFPPAQLPTSSAARAALTAAVTAEHMQLHCGLQMKPPSAILSLSSALQAATRAISFRAAS